MAVYSSFPKKEKYVDPFSGLAQAVRKANKTNTPVQHAFYQGTAPRVGFWANVKNTVFTKGMPHGTGKNVWVDPDTGVLRWATKTNGSNVVNAFGKPLTEAEYKSVAGLFSGYNFEKNSSGNYVYSGQKNTNDYYTRLAKKKNAFKQFFDQHKKINNIETEQPKTQPTQPKKPNIGVEKTPTVGIVPNPPNLQEDGDTLSNYPGGVSHAIPPGAQNDGELEKMVKYGMIGIGALAVLSFIRG